MNSATLSTKRQWIAELARSQRGTAVYLLHNLTDLHRVREAYR